MPRIRFPTTCRCYNIIFQYSFTETPSFSTFPSHEAQILKSSERPRHKLRKTTPTYLMASSLAHYYSEESPDPSLATIYPLSTYIIPYFKRDTNGQSRFSVFAPAQEAFDLALEKFKQTSTKRWEKRRTILEATSLRDVLDVVAAAQNRYANEHTKSKTRTCITELSKRVCYYGKVMDVLVQHHPEYVSLAWGAMKLVFGVGTHSLSRQVATVHNRATRLLSNTRT